MTGRPNALADIESAVWDELVRATKVKTHEWRSPVLATVSGNAADARTVILREADRQERQLTVFTDQRAGKVVQLLSHPRGTLVMWSPRLGWQLRCRVFLTLEMTGLAVSSFWARINLTPAANDYLAPLPPGAPLDAAPAPPAAKPLPARHEYFAVVNAQVLSIDWLELHRDGNRRAVFGEGESRWLQP